MMDVKKLAAIYDDLGRSYLASIDDVTPRQLSEFKKIIKTGGRVLDVGCAGGRDTRKFSDVGFDAYGIDISQVFLTEAARRSPHAKFLQMDLRDLSFEDGLFDALWCHAVLHHIAKSDIPDALLGFRRVLAPGGIMHLSVKEGAGEHSVGEVLTGGKERPFIFFRMEELEKFITDAGFTVVKSMYLPDMLGRDNVRWICVWARK